MRSLMLALRALRREWRSGELAVLWLSLAIAVAALTGVGFLVDRIGRAVTLQASEMLAADLRVESDAADPERGGRPRRSGSGLASAHLTMTLSAIFNGDANQLADVRAVSAGYPLRGQLTIADRPFATGMLDARRYPRPARRGPTPAWPPRSGWASAASSPSGRGMLRVTHILISRPDQSATFVEFAPALLINDADLPATQLDAARQPGRITRCCSPARARGSRPFAHWHSLHASAHERVADVADASPQIGDASRRAARFLALASLVAVLLCAVSIAMSARSYVRRHLDAVALMKTLGASRRVVLAVSLWQLLALALVASVLGASRRLADAAVAGARTAGVCCARICRRPGRGRRWWASSWRWRCSPVSRCPRCCSSRACRRCGCCAVMSGRRRSACGPRRCRWCSPSRRGVRGARQICA